MDRRELIAAALLCGLGVRARAAGGSVAVLPAHVFRGAEANGPVVTTALEESLRGRGFDVMTRERVAARVKERDLDLSKPQSARALVALRRDLGADFLIYPRVLGVGRSLSTDRYQATVLVNAVAESETSFYSTRQIGREFDPAVRDPNKAVLPRDEAAAMAGDLLITFYRKAGDR